MALLSYGSRSLATLNPFAAVGLGAVVVASVVSGTVGCGPGPLPAENPPTELSARLEPMPVQVESTVQAGVTRSSTQGALRSPAVSERTLPASLGFKTPESVLYDAETDTYLVANVNGAPTTLDNNGFISRINPDGSVVDLAFIAGGKAGVTLNAPKGMAFWAGVLYVTDVNAVRTFDAKTGRALDVVSLPSATFANDITFAPSGAAFVSDSGLDYRDGELQATGTDAIYRLEKDRVSVVVAGRHLEQPNGLLYQDGTLWCASFGSNKLRQLDLAGEIITTVALPGGTLDGIVVLPDGQLVVSSWEKRSLYVGTASRGFKLLRHTLAAPADIGVDLGRHRLLVPLFLNDELSFVDDSYASFSANSSPVALTPQL